MAKTGNKVDIITEHITHIVHEMIAGINNRSFDLSSHPWQHIAPDFECESYLLGQHTKHTFVQFLEYIEHVIASENFRLITNAIRVHVNDKKTRVDVFVNDEFTGLPDGIARPGVTVMEFRNIKEMWMCTKIMSMRGLDGLERDIRPSCV